MSKVSVIVPVYNVENYIRDMLRSVQNQTFKDFEVILINDGSTDNSQFIIEEFCRADKRFKSFSQANGGVAAARNSGIEKATGDYLVFYDPDDYVPCQALEKMYNTALKNNSDMVIGIMEEKSLGESMIYMASQILSKKKSIEPTDINFIRAWSLCNKMFSTNFIKKNGLLFEDLYNAEDGVFTFCALNCLPRISGCNIVAYNYIRRPFWLGASATQIINKDYFNGLMMSHDRIIEEATKLAQQIKNLDEREKYLQSLFFRFIDAEMLTAYYRLIWKASDDILSLLTKRTESYTRNITQLQWDNLVRKHIDLRLNEGFIDTLRLAKVPDVSIIISRSLDGEQLNFVLGSIYNQLYQRFEVIIPKEMKLYMPKEYNNYPNIKYYENTIEEVISSLAKGEYINIIDEKVLFTKESIKQMVDKMRNNHNLQFVSMLLKSFDGKEYKQIPCLSASYGYTKAAKTKYTKLTKCDALFANKLFRRRVLENFEFSDNPAQDVERLYKNLRFEKLRKGVMITDCCEEDFLKKAEIVPSSLAVKLEYAKNEAIRRIIEKLKRYINKDDIKKIRRIIRG